MEDAARAPDRPRSALRSRQPARGVRQKEEEVSAGGVRVFGSGWRSSGYRIARDDRSSKIASNVTRDCSGRIRKIRKDRKERRSEK